MVVLLAVGWLGWVYYACHYTYQKLVPVMSAPQVKLVATKFVPVPVKEIRRVNLGYGTISLPAFVGGNPVTLYPDGSAIIIPSVAVLLLPPVKASRIGDEMIRPIQQLTEKPISNMFELQKMTVAAQPYSFFGMLLMRPKKWAERGLLLTYKAVQVGRETSTVEIMERRGVGAFVQTDTDRRRINVEIFDWEHDTRQVVSIAETDLTRAREIVSALLSDYTMPLADDSDAALKRLIDEAKIPPAPSREAAEPAALTPAR